MTEFKCDSSDKEKYFATAVAKQFFFIQHAVLAKFHWVFLNTFFPLSHHPHSSQSRSTFHLSGVIVVALPAVTVTAFHLCSFADLSLINTSSNICKVLRHPFA